MFKIRKRSAWEWKASAGTSVGIEFISAGKGTFALKAPDGSVAEFSYMTAGLGFGKGGPLNQSTSTDHVDKGRLYLLEKFAGAELTTSDIEGFCLVQEIAIGAGIGASAAAMLLGIPKKSLPAEAVRNTGALGQAARIVVDHPEVLLGPLGIIANDKLRILDKVLVLEALKKLLQSEAKALLVMLGSNKGQQLQAGISGSVGYVALQKVQSPEPVPPPPPPPPPPRKGYVIELPTDVLFGFDQSFLKREAEAVLKDYASRIRAKNPRHVFVEGHTDDIGSAEYNDALSLRRARAVASWLVAHKVIDAGQIVTFGYGESRPIAANSWSDGRDYPEGRALNRRVELFLVDY